MKLKVGDSKLELERYPFFQNQQNFKLKLGKIEEH